MIDKDERQIDFKLLTPVTNYTITLKTVTQSGAKGISKEVYFQTDQEVPKGPPLDVQVELTDFQTFKIKWKPPKAELRFGQIKGYYIGYRLINSESLFNYKNFFWMITIKPKQE